MMMNGTVASLGLLSPGAATDGVTLFSPKKLATFFSCRYKVTFLPAIWSHVPTTPIFRHRTVFFIQIQPHFFNQVSPGVVRPPSPLLTPLEWKLINSLFINRTKWQNVSMQVSAQYAVTPIHTTTTTRQPRSTCTINRATTNLPPLPMASTTARRSHNSTRSAPPSNSTSSRTPTPSVTSSPLETGRRITGPSGVTGVSSPITEGASGSRLTWRRLAFTADRPTTAISPTIVDTLTRTVLALVAPPSVDCAVKTSLIVRQIRCQSRNSHQSNV